MRGGFNWRFDCSTEYQFSRVKSFQFSLTFLQYVNFSWLKIIFPDFSLTLKSVFFFWPFPVKLNHTVKSRIGSVFWADLTNILNCLWITESDTIYWDWSYVADMETPTWPGLNRRALAGTNLVSMYLHSSKKRGFSKWPKTLQDKEKTKVLVKRLHFKLSYDNFTIKKYM